MLKIIPLLLALLASPAFAGERVIINPDQDGDLKIKVNDGGTVTDVIVADGPSSNVGLWTAAPASTPGFSRVLHLLSASDVGLRLQSSGGSWEIGNNTGNALQFYSGSTLTAEAATGGAWTLGPSAANVTHAVRGGIDFGSALTVGSGSSSSTTVLFPSGDFAGSGGNGVGGAMYLADYGDSTSHSTGVFICNAGRQGGGIQVVCTRLGYYQIGSVNISHIDGAIGVAGITFSFSSPTNYLVTRIMSW